MTNASNVKEKLEPTKKEKDQKTKQNIAYTPSYLQMYQEATNTPKHGAKPKLELIQKNKVSIIPSSEPNALEDMLKHDTY